jgi:hypothetical protein
LYGHRSSCKQGIDGISSFMFYRQLLLRVAVDPSLITQDSLLIEYESSGTELLSRTRFQNS